MKRKIGFLLLIACTLVFSGCTKEERLITQQQTEEMGMSLMDQGDYEGAVKAFDEALGLCLGNITNKEIEINFYKAAAQYMSGDGEGALATYTALIDYEKDDPKPYFLRGSAYLKQGETDLAISDYKSAVSLSDSDYEMYIECYNNLHAAGLEAEALSFLNAALELNGRNAESYLARGRIYLIMEQYDLAQDQLITAKDKGLADAAVYLAQVYQATGAIQSAESILTEYTADGNASSVAMNIMAIIAMKDDDFQTALNYINQGLALDEVTNQQSLMRNKIICLEKMGDFTEAYNTAAIYCGLYPKDDDASRELTFLSTRNVSVVEEYYHMKDNEEESATDSADTEEKTEEGDEE